jgi:hypothetical protein
MTIRRELLDELLKDYQTPQDVLGILVLFEQFIKQFGPNSHAVLLFSCSHVFPL